MKRRTMADWIVRVLDVFLRNCFWVIHWLPVTWVWGNRKGKDAALSRPANEALAGSLALGVIRYSQLDFIYPDLQQISHPPQDGVDAFGSAECWQLKWR